MRTHTVVVYEHIYSSKGRDLYAGEGGGGGVNTLLQETTAGASRTRRLEEAV